MQNHPESISDETLARQAQAGSLPAFDELIARYHRRIYGFVAQSCSNPADAAEVTQETFIKAFQAIGTFDPRRSFAPWLFAIARRKGIDHYRAARPLPEESIPEVPDPPTPAEELAAHEEDQHLWALARSILPDIQFQALWLRYAEDMPIEAIAHVLGKTQTHLKVLLFRARRRLAHAIGSTEHQERTLPERRAHRIAAASSPIAVPISKQLL